jgi:putative two-component system response regulator
MCTAALRPCTSGGHCRSPHAWSGAIISTSSAQAILVVDDNDDNAEIVRALLESRGFPVIVAHDGDTALALFDSARPPLVLLDVLMPGRSGWEVCRLMRQHPEHGRSVRIIMLTALADWNDKQSAIQTGADDYITKPLDLADLELRVRRNLALVTPAT